MKFRFRNKFLMLTYKTHLEIEKLIKVITTKSKKNIKCKIAHESGDQNHNYLHTHILIQFITDRRIDIKNERRFDIDGIHPHWKAIKTEEHYKRVFEYLDKENCVYSELEGDEYPENTGFSSDLINKIQAHRSFYDVVCDIEITYEISNKMRWARTVFDARPKPNLTADLKLNKFQETTINLINKQNDREILWVYDEKGGAGKSVLTNYLIDNDDAFFCNGGKLSDIAHAYNYEKIVIFDLPRCNEDFTPYKAMESFKDGRLFSPKYDSKMKRFEPTKVVVFANFEPDKRKLSMDRWNIWDLDKEIPQIPRGYLNIKDNPGGETENVSDENYISDFESSD